tara:strand:+ start:5514 stop:5672 length:159 start_codon:yes stop_codon:yes gene_type:complete
MDDKIEGLQKSAFEIHAALKRHYESWQLLEMLAKHQGYTIDTKTAELKPLKQ